MRCTFSIPDDLWAVEADEGQMNQVIHNLVINAQQAMPDGGTVRVRAENIVVDSGRNLPLRAGRYVKVSIGDKGVGISAEHLPKVFDPYFTTKQKGSGLGLASAHSIVKSHDGTMMVESELGVGTIFSIYLPASSEVIPTRQEMEEISMVSQGKILVMDDEEVVRNATGGILARMGYETEFACDGAEAIEKYQNALTTGKPFDAAIMDLTVPGGMGGKEAIQKLLTIDPQAKVIVSSGYSNDPIMADYARYGFCGVLPKPYKTVDLQRLLHNVVTGRKDEGLKSQSSDRPV